MNNHLTFTKWKGSAFSSEHLRSQRWLLGAKPNGAHFQKMLTVTPQAQAVLMKLHIRSFLQATRRATRSVQRTRARATQEEFEKMVEFACVFSFMRQ